MTNEDPGYKSECLDAVADYDYELAMTSSHARYRVTQETPLIETRRHAPPSRRFAVIVAYGFVVFLAGFAYFIYTQMDSEALTPTSSKQPIWTDSLEPPIQPPVTTPRPHPEPGINRAPSLKPQPIRCTGTPISKPSYQAVGAVVLDIHGVPMDWPGYVGVAGPEGLLPVMVDVHQLNWWWNWRVDSNGCGDYRLEPERLR